MTVSVERSLESGRQPLPPRPAAPGRLAPAEMWPAGEAGLEARFVGLASGERVRVIECGRAGGAPVLMLHGWCCSAYTFRHNVAALSDAGCRVVLVDLRGHGLSDKPEGLGEYTLRRMADHVVEVMDAVGMPRAALVGHSMGCAIAVRVALDHPERVNGLALFAPVGFGAVGVLGLARRLTPAPIEPLLPRLARRWLFAAVLRLAYGRLGHCSPRDVDEYWAPTQFPAFLPAMRALLHAFEWAPGERGELAGLTVPVFVMLGTRDRLVYDPSVEAMVRAIPRSVFELVPGAGHVLPEEVPERVNAVLARFAALVS